MASADQCDLLCLDLEVAEAIRTRAAQRGDEMRIAAERARGFGDPTRLALAAALVVAGLLS